MVLEVVVLVMMVVVDRSACGDGCSWGAEVVVAVVMGVVNDS